jgi:hypothetical protein
VSEGDILQVVVRAAAQNVGDFINSATLSFGSFAKNEERKQCAQHDEWNERIVAQRLLHGYCQDKVMNHYVHYFNVAD